MSYVILPASKVRELCKQTLSNIEASRANSRRKYLDSQIARSKNSFWRRLFREPIITDEQIIVRDKGDTHNIWGSGLFWASYGHSEQERLAERLLKAADIGDPVYVSVADLVRIS